MGFCGKPHIFSLSENILIFTLTIPRLLLSKPKAFISPFTRYKTFVSLLKELLSGVAFFTAKRWYLYITSLCSSVSSCKWAALSHWINSLFPHFSSQPLIIPDHPLRPVISCARNDPAFRVRGSHLCADLWSHWFRVLMMGILPNSRSLRWRYPQSPFAAPRLWFQAAPDTPNGFLSPRLTSYKLLFLPTSSGLRWLYDGKFYKLKIKKLFLKT